ncbi:type VII secretion-associated serine protease mycosin [Kitasatospora sp. HPMI-4]|uniref:type VII secretion-associated serine protease mycosin n=1 Tax=Kitasatospora sp. HPMI-4 TaxID=3448443 RepID=UPI003F1B6A64
MRIHQRRTRIAWTSTIALIVASMTVQISGAAQAESIRSAEWPLDSAHFDAERIWSVSRGAGVTVAVLDTGVAASHPDLTGQVTEGTSLLGDQGDGRTDSSSDSHGTAIAGIIAGSGGPDHVSGIMGLAPAARILPVRVAAGTAISPSLLAQGLTWAVDHGAKVVNISSGTPQPDPLLRQAVDYALRHDVVVVAAAGNQGDKGNPPQYPAAFPGVVSVSGIDRSGGFWAPSESGTGVVLAAPAAQIYSTNDQNAYVNADGTSYAAAYVSAAAALIRAHSPAMTASQTIHRLIDTASQHHQVPDAHLGYGIVNPLAALTDTTPPSTDPANPLLHAPRTESQDSSSPALFVWIGCAAAAILATAMLARFWLRRRKPASPAVTPASTRPRPAKKPSSGTPHQSTRKTPKGHRNP